MKTIYLMRLYMILLAACVCMEVKGSEESALQALEKWENTIVQMDVKRSSVRPATKGLDFDIVILPMEETKKLINNKVVPRADLEKALIRQIVIRARSRMAGTKQHGVNLYPKSFYGYLYCELIGLDRKNLLLLIGDNEINIDVVLAVLFAGEDIPEGGLPPPFELKK
ncbi:MAG TPA: hypothetical protein DDZ88_01990 [Verrucomicrobiales bacterium]|nr:hypothetical protein [Verrucomicrobiales bacterium]